AAFEKDLARLLDAASGSSTRPGELWRGRGVGDWQAIMDDESPDRHRLHRMHGNADSDMAYAGRGAKQDHLVLCGELRRLLCHGLLPTPALREPSLLRSSSRAHFFNHAGCFTLNTPFSERRVPKNCNMRIRTYLRASICRCNLFLGSKVRPTENWSFSSPKGSRLKNTIRLRHSMA